jgi:hypothetical protein
VGRLFVGCSPICLRMLVATPGRGTTAAFDPAFAECQTVVTGWGLVRKHAAGAARVLPRPAPPRSARRYASRKRRILRRLSSRSSAPSRQSETAPKPRLCIHVGSDANALPTARPSFCRFKSVIRAAVHRKTGPRRTDRGPAWRGCSDRVSAWRVPRALSTWSGSSRKRRLLRTGGRDETPPAELVPLR